MSSTERRVDSLGAEGPWHKNRTVGRNQSGNLIAVPGSTPSTD
jgi:hypothetical protein